MAGMTIIDFDLFVHCVDGMAIKLEVWQRRFVHRHKKQPTTAQRIEFLKTV